MSPSEEWDTGVPLDFSGLTLSLCFDESTVQLCEEEEEE